MGELIKEMARLAKNPPYVFADSLVITKPWVKTKAEKDGYHGLTRFLLTPDDWLLFAQCTFRFEGLKIEDETEILLRLRVRTGQTTIYERKAYSRIHGYLEFGTPTVIGAVNLNQPATVELDYTRQGDPFPVFADMEPPIIVATKTAGLSVIA
jgi:hypothetical protein